jgi:hypothetical protein
MMNISVIKLHSFVDLITNSSSELFVCECRKSLETVKEIVEKIIFDHCKEYDQKTPTKDVIWGGMFAEPSISTFEFNLNEYPNQEDIAKTDYWDWTEVHREEIDKKLKKKFPDRPCFEKMTWEEKAKDYAYSCWYKRKVKYQEELERPLREEHEAAKRRILDYFKVPESEEYVLPYNIKLRKGDILLHSASDNSVPYECWDKINSLLNAENYHLG